MPHGYEVMKEKFYKENLKKGMTPANALKAAKTKAARIWNSSHKKNPVTGPDHD